MVWSYTSKTLRTSRPLREFLKRQAHFEITWRNISPCLRASVFPVFKRRRHKTRHCVARDNIRETTFYCASGNTRSLYFKLKCADVAAHTLKNVVFQMLSSLFIRNSAHALAFRQVRGLTPVLSRNILRKWAVTL